MARGTIELAACHSIGLHQLPSILNRFRRNFPAVEVRVCLGEACQSVGARALMSEATATIEPDGEVTQVFCLGNCALGPTATVNGTLLGRASGTAIRAAVAEARVS